MTFNNKTMQHEKFFLDHTSWHDMSMLTRKMNPKIKSQNVMFDMDNAFALMWHVIYASVRNQIQHTCWNTKHYQANRYTKDMMNSSQIQEKL